MKIVVRISGGVLVSVYSDDPTAAVQLFDEDNLNEEETDSTEKDFENVTEKMTQVYP